MPHTPVCIKVAVVARFVIAFVTKEFWRVMLVCSLHVSVQRLLYVTRKLALVTLELFLAVMPCHVIFQVTFATVSTSFVLTEGALENHSLVVLLRQVSFKCEAFWRLERTFVAEHLTILMDFLVQYQLIFLLL